MINGRNPEYEKCRNELNTRYKEIRLGNFHREWTSSISMLYHHPKHAGEFGDPPVPINDYFGILSERLFHEGNVVSETYSQDGLMVKRTHVSRFKFKKHIGFIVVINGREKIASHFTDDFIKVNK